ncbi:hypothetical protein [Salmonella enterica]|uniref:hypothetical protein n=1 Tax=Salmonella enterica TaxID=28901 RepID=UPI00288E5C87|nr:hypothetical protein [Salmonella enterica]MDT1790507.1 hypothetical protein [Salmonella enterica subsp. enterica serovar Oslo]
MTDEINSHTLSAVSDNFGTFWIACYRDGGDAFILESKEYIGWMTTYETLYAVDGEVFTYEPHRRTLRYDGFITATEYNQELVQAISNGKELRVKQLAKHNDSVVHKFDTSGFNEAYAEFMTQCSSFW